jgi:nucleotide-binding universal stress UspA family protein
MTSEERSLRASIVAAIDGTESALDAATLATNLAQAAGAPLILVCVHPERVGAAGTATAASASLEAARQAVGDAAADARVIVSSSAARGRRVLLGAVSAALVRQASVPVLVVPRSDPGRQHTARTSEPSTGAVPPEHPTHEVE